ncbi:MAG: 5-(carboxyamino)imidazole ribonucleotide synthase [Cyanomargarita calcarea GSE-NOS-MK-12-04C]|jgi:5-(carboxyamino)imidazole ribonucleotide synthase|uniref:N5-carboxyaminoimidazole ribonucleotide synthase n=1 Tax=Cyanomargarita calcarea GSE-NOS-MK-12-04C TaxID=2839659 RepID=A0A951UTX5_9CYAN|nr:5-(carboxyamino)imidazole ribonucleotide synthase [Cyanomargarita calcarea GSE-NOS-MK-12-04C]
MKRVGVIGGGQLALMMADAAKKLNLELVVQTPNRNDPAVGRANDVVFASVDSAIATGILAEKCDVITFENEFVDLEALSVLANKGVCFRPRIEALAPLLDKYDQRCYLRDLGLPVPKFFNIDRYKSAQEKSLKSQVAELGFPVVLKARRHGYDGQGTFIINDFNELLRRLDFENIKSPRSQPLFLLEEFIPFERELAIIAARSVSGEVVAYPVVETQQEEQVCRRVIAPASLAEEVVVEIDKIAQILLNSLEAVGIFGIELFLTVDGKVLVNEIAPRTHNSGHFSLDACSISQFEQHLRAVCGLPLGSPALICAGAVMVNLLGYDGEREYQSKLENISKIPKAHFHWYGKTESRPGRKLGHVTVLLDNNNREQALAIAKSVELIWYHN